MKRTASDVATRRPRPSVANLPPHAGRPQASDPNAEDLGNYRRLDLTKAEFDFLLSFVEAAMIHCRDELMDDVPSRSAVAAVYRELKAFHVKLAELAP